MLNADLRKTKIGDLKMKISLNNNTQQKHALKQQQQQYDQHEPDLNPNLLSTAATGAGIVDDLDGPLLTPMQKKLPTKVRHDSRPERNLWRLDEILLMLNTMKQMNAMELLNDKTFKSENIFVDVEKIMKSKGYKKKSHTQIWTKWKFLKSTYTTSKRNGVVPKMIPYPVYEVLHSLLSSAASSNGGTSAPPSINGDSSDADHDGSMFEEQQAADEAEETVFGMGHPIFGFRLANTEPPANNTTAVKQEPLDLGYETINDSIEQQHAEHAQEMHAINLPFQTDFKPECIVPTIAQTPEIMLHKHAKKQKKQRDKHAPPPAPTAATSKPTATAQLPPLRVAPFAKEPIANLATLTCKASPKGNAATPQPPPLIIQPSTTRAATRLSYMQHAVAAKEQQQHATNNVGNETMRKIFITPAAAATLAGLPQLQSMKYAAGMRLPKEITLSQTRATTINATSSNLRLKQVPMRETPYSLRPERLIPDLESSTSPPPALAQTPDYIATTQYQNVAANSSSATTAAVLTPTAKKRKRRLDIPLSHGLTITPTNTTKKARHNNAVDNNDDDDDAEEDDDEQQFEATGNNYAFDWSNNNQQQQDHQQHFKQKLQKHNGKKHAATSMPAAEQMQQQQLLFSTALKDVGSSLRRMQQQMLKDFFEKQMELARREHEFQMRQDLLLMQAFEAQSKELMTFAKQLLTQNLDETTTTNGSSITAEPTEKRISAATQTDEMLLTEKVTNQTAAMEIQAATVLEQSVNGYAAEAEHQAYLEYFVKNGQKLKELSSAYEENETEQAENEVYATDESDSDDAAENDDDDEDEDDDDDSSTTYDDEDINEENANENSNNYDETTTSNEKADNLQQHVNKEKIANFQVETTAADSTNDANSATVAVDYMEANAEAIAAAHDSDADENDDEEEAENEKAESNGKIH